jgi:hypothetical protein
MASWQERSAFDRFYDVDGEPWGRVKGRRGIRLHYHDFRIGRPQRQRGKKIAQALKLKANQAIMIVGAGFNWSGEGLQNLGIEVVGTDTSDYILANLAETEESELRNCCHAVGVDPDNDLIICDRYQRGARLEYAPGRQADHAAWLIDPREKESRALWLAKHGDLSCPQDWMAPPLQIYLRRDVAGEPMARCHCPVIGEDMATRGSRSTIKRRLKKRLRYILSEELINAIDDNEALAVCEAMAKMANEHGGTVVHALSALGDITTDDFGMRLPSHDETLNWKTYNGYYLITTEITGQRQSIERVSSPGWRQFLDRYGFFDQKILPTVTKNGVKAYSELI